MCNSTVDNHKPHINDLEASTHAFFLLRLSKEFLSDEDSVANLEPIEIPGSVWQYRL